MQINAQQAMPQNSAANPLPATFYAAQFRCRQTRPNFAKRLIDNIYSIRMGWL
jgi:hypothetical protein